MGGNGDGTGSHGHGAPVSEFGLAPERLGLRARSTFAYPDPSGVAHEDDEDEHDDDLAYDGYERVVSLRTVARFLDLSPSGARKFVQRHHIGRVPLGHRSTRYRISEVAAIVDALERSARRAP